MVDHFIHLPGLDAKVAEDGGVFLQSSSKGVRLESKLWIDFVNKVNDAIHRQEDRRSTLIDNDTFRLSVNAFQNDRIYSRRYAPPWRDQPFGGNYYVNITFKHAWNGANFTFDRVEWEHIVAGYYRYRDSTEWVQKRNREIKQWRNFIGGALNVIPYAATYYRAPYGKRDRSRCRFDWLRETGDVLVYFYRQTLGNAPYHAFKGDAFEEVIAKVEAHLMGVQYE